jgi:hypothetical protein
MIAIRGNLLQSRSWVLAFVVAAFVLLYSIGSHAQEAIGSATAVRPQAEGTHEGETHTLSGGTAVYTNELIQTGNTGLADLRFRDSTNLTVGPKAEVRLDKFVYEPKKSAGSAAVEVARGSFRFVTGPQSKGVDYQIKTPFGTLGVRG